MTVLMLATALTDRRFNTIEDLTKLIDDVGGCECVSLLIHDGIMSSLYLPGDIELFNDEFLSQEIKNISISSMDAEHSLILHVTI